MAYRNIELTLDVPSSVSGPELRQYMTVALERWGGAFHPDDHLCNTIKVKGIKFVAARKKELV